MIQHHAQALAMVDLPVGRQLDPQVQQVAEDIREAEGPEIEQMAGWLTDRDGPIPETMRDHAKAHGEGDVEMDSDMPGRCRPRKWPRSRQPRAPGSRRCGSR